MRTGVPCERTGHVGEPHGLVAFGDGVAEGARDDLTELTRRLVVLRRAARVLSILPVRDDRLGMSRHRIGDRGGRDHECVDREPGTDHDAQYPGAPEGIPSAAAAKKGET